MANQTYWTFLLEIINLWSRYQTAKKLYINATNEETHFKVAGVIDRYYGGNIAKLENTVSSMSNRLDSKLARFNYYYRRLWVQPITRDWLERNIPDGKAAGKYRRFICKNFDDDSEPTSL